MTEEARNMRKDTIPDLAAVHGFVLWISSYVLLVAYLGWAYIPESILQTCGITYYPSKYWAIALPAQFVASVIFYFLVVVCLNLKQTPSLASFYTFRDKHSRIKVSMEGTSHYDDAPTPDISDMPIKLVNDLLFLQD